MDRGDDALAMVGRAVELAPENGEFQTQLGELFSVFKKDQAAALAHTARGLALDPGEWNWVIHAQAQYRAGHADQCLQSLDQGAKVRTAVGPGPRNAQLSNLTRVACLVGAGRVDDARKAMAALPDEQRGWLTKPVPPKMPANVRHGMEELQKAVAPLMKEAPHH